MQTQNFEINKKKTKWENLKFQKYYKIYVYFLIQSAFASDFLESCSMI